MADTSSKNLQRYIVSTLRGFDPAKAEKVAEWYARNVENMVKPEMSEKNRTVEIVMEQEFSDIFKHSLENIVQQLYGAVYKEAKKQIKLEGQDYQTGFEQGIAQAKKKLYEHFPMWKIAPADDYIRETVLAGCGEFGMKVLHRGQLIKEGWKYIPIKSLKMLPVEVAEDNGKEE